MLALLTQLEHAAPAGPGAACGGTGSPSTPQTASQAADVASRELTQRWGDLRSPQRPTTPLGVKSAKRFSTGPARHRRDAQRYWPDHFSPAMTSPLLRRSGHYHERMSQERIDPMLRILVNVANGMKSPDDKIGITLTVQGLVVSGDLISASRWVEEMASKPGIGLLERLFTQYRDMIDEAQQEERAAMKSVKEDDLEALKTHDEKYPAAQFIHLKKSEIYGSGEHGKSIPADAQAYWRGRLSEVSGWTLGRLTAPAQQ